jgi:hypothetical protein
MLLIVEVGCRPIYSYLWALKNYTVICLKT